MAGDGHCEEAAECAEIGVVPSGQRAGGEGTTSRELRPFVAEAGELPPHCGSENEARYEKGYCAGRLPFMDPDRLIRPTALVVARAIFVVGRIPFIEMDPADREWVCRVGTVVSDQAARMRG